MGQMLMTALSKDGQDLSYALMVLKVLASIEVNKTVLIGCVDTIGIVRKVRKFNVDAPDAQEKLNEIRRHAQEAYTKWKAMCA